MKGVAAQKSGEVVQVPLKDDICYKLLFRAVRDMRDPYLNGPARSRILGPVEDRALRPARTLVCQQLALEALDRELGPAGKGEAEAAGMRPVKDRVWDAIPLRALDRVLVGLGGDVTAEHYQTPAVREASIRVAHALGAVKGQLEGGK